MTSTVSITAADVNKLRMQTGAGMMDCKKALTEANGDFEAAIDILRKKGQKVAANRADREAKEGVILARTDKAAKTAIIVGISCETDFVAKNEAFINFAHSILNVAMDKKPATAEELKAQMLDGITIETQLIDQVGKIGEKIELSRFEKIEAPKVVAYNHPGNRLATIAGFSSESTTDEIAKDVAMQIAAMAPVAVDKNDVDATLLERELEIGREQARNEGKPEAMIEKIAQGKLNKFYKESTLLNQEFVKDPKKTVSQYLNEAEKGLTVTAFKRVALS